MLQRVYIGQVYKHKFNRQLYLVEGIGLNSDNPLFLKAMVYFKALYNAENKHWMKSLDKFKKSFEEYQE
ncbi:hypothetical protein ACT8ZR_09120 [Neobacillus sp. M.A.Huq-85]